jgi:hypothetical protein
MKLKNLKVNLGLTLNTGDYNSIRPEVSLEYEISEEENLQECHTIIMRKAKWLLLRQVVLLSAGKNSILENLREDMIGYLKDYFNKQEQLPE